MPRGIPLKTKAERIKRLLRQKWSKKRIVETVGCSVPYVYMIEKEMKQDAIVAKLMKAG